MYVASSLGASFALPANNCDSLTPHHTPPLRASRRFQEKRRRAAGQRHWEEWVSRKSRCSKSGAAVNGDDNDRQRGGVDAGIEGEGAAGEAAERRRREQRERQEDEDRRRKKEQDEAFAAWAREKDKVLRARKREVCASVLHTRWNFVRGQAAAVLFLRATTGLESSVRGAAGGLRVWPPQRVCLIQTSITRGSY